MTLKTSRDEISPYITKDGSEIRELLHPAHHGARNQSLAEALVPAGCTTLLHWHEITEEIYHVTRGTGIMTLGSNRFPIGPGDSVLIPPGTPHCVTNAGETELLILCCCAPAYAHDDTVLLDTTA